MAVQMGDHNKIKYINLTMDEIHAEADCIYESMMDEDVEGLDKALKRLSLLIAQIQTNHAENQRTS